MSTDTPETVERGPKQQRGIQSMDVGIRVLRAIASSGKPVGLMEIARATSMSSANVHAYLVSFARGDLVKQDLVTGHYWLGPLAVELGLAALDRLEPVTEATPDAVELAKETNLGVTISVWGNRGPAVVRFDRPAYPVHVSISIGTVLSLLNTSTGKVFGAYLPAGLIETFATEEMDGSAGGLPKETRRNFFKELEEVRLHGLAQGLGIPIPGINSLCVPVFDSRGQIAAAITVFGPDKMFDGRTDGPIAEKLRARAQAVSQRLGHACTTEAPSSAIVRRRSLAGS